MIEKYLPIGTVVTLKKGTKKIMITGYLPTTEDNKVFEYSACLFPEGVISSDEVLVFNQDQIDTIHYLGLTDQDYKDFNKEIKKTIQNIKNIEQQNSKE